jgi:hypothetical protein
MICAIIVNNQMVAKEKQEQLIISEEKQETQEKQEKQEK